MSRRANINFMKECEKEDNIINAEIVACFYKINVFD